MVGGLEHFSFSPYIRNNHPNWLILFKGVETTNQIWEFVWIDSSRFILPGVEMDWVKNTGPITRIWGSGKQKRQFHTKFIGYRSWWEYSMISSKCCMGTFPRGPYVLLASGVGVWGPAINTTLTLHVSPATTKTNSTVQSKLLAPPQLPVFRAPDAGAEGCRFRGIGTANSPEFAIRVS